MAEDIKVDDPVRVSRNGGRASDGKVVKVGRTLIHIEYDGTVRTFTRDGHRLKENGQVYSTTRFQTMAEVALWQRRVAAVGVIQQHGFRADYGGIHTSLEKLEAVAAALKSFD